MGAACARLLGHNGYRVVAVDRDESAVRLTVSELPDAVAVQADVTVEADAERMVDDAVRAFGRLDGAVNAAGVSQQMVPTAQLSTQEWRRVLSINLDGVFFSLRAEIPALLEDGGSIVNFGSTLSVAGSGSGVAAYVASKHAVLGLTRAAALEYAVHGVRVNAVGPGIIETPMTGVWDESKRASQIAKHPVGRFGTPAEVAALVEYLLAPAAGYVTGSFFAIDGGFGAQ
jgi:NAD(P)-dependent dehydrogenase (short-subunit alcohol dehydrogenase family)